MRTTLLGLLRGVLFLFLCLVTILFALRRLSDETGLIEIGDDEVAVLYNRLSGTTRQVDTPGNELYLPFIERIYLQRRSSEALSFEGKVRKDSQHVPEIRLRIADGSVVRFESFSLQYTLGVDGAQRALEDSGGREEWRAELIETKVRAIVRDEYGNYDGAAIRQRESQNAASAATLSRLNETLRPHGIAVLELSTPKLRFDPAYETAVAARKAALQEVEKLRAEFRQLDAEQNQRMAVVEKEKMSELNKTRLKLTEYMVSFAKEDRLRRAKAESEYAARVGDAQNRRYALEQDALALTEKYTLEANAFRQEVELLASAGTPFLREAWIERLAQTPVRLQPFSHDPAPAGVELLKTALVIK